MPFQKHVYYPLASGLDGADVPAAAAGAASLASAASSAAAGSLPFFQFRPRLESVDWRRLSAIDVDKVAGAVDVLTLQENIMNITFCKLEDEKCPHCQCGVDPVLLKLIRLAQLTIEYLMHSQEFLTAQLRQLEERLRLSLADGEQSKQLLAKQAGDIRSLKEECKRRKKMISTQQLMIEAKTSYYQCHFCDKAFMNQAFLQSHIQRRHPEDSHLAGYKKREQTDRLQNEVDMLKEQLQLTRTQLEAAQHAHAVRFSKEYELQKAKDQEFLKLFDQWKEEEKEKLVDEMEKVKEMFMKEFKELTSKNSALEYQLSEIQKSNMQIKSNIGTLKDAHEFKEERPQHPQDFQNVMQLLDSQESKWTARVQALHQEHKKEKGRLLSHIEKLRTSMIDNLNASNVFYKKRIEELGQRLQEQNELIISQRHQIKEFSSKPVSSNSEVKGPSLSWQPLESKPTVPTVPMAAPAPQTMDVKPSLTVAHGATLGRAQRPAGPHPVVLGGQVVLRIEPRASRMPGRENEQKFSNDKMHLRKALKNNPTFTKEIRAMLEQSLVEKLETLGINAGVCGIPTEHLNRVLRAMETTRLERERQIPNMQQIREFLEHQISCKIEERASLSNERQWRHVSDAAITVHGFEKHSVSQMDTMSTGEVPKAAQLAPKSRQLVRQRPVFTDRTAPKVPKRTSMEELIPRKSSTLTSGGPCVDPFKTPPFSSEEDLDGDDDLIPAYVSPVAAPSTSATNGHFGKNVVKSDTDWMEGSEVEDSDLSPKPNGTSIMIQTESVDKMPSSHRNLHKPVGFGIAEKFVRKEMKEDLKCADVEDDDWDISSLEDEKSLGQRPGQDHVEPRLFKSDSNPTQVPSAWGPPNPKGAKEEGLLGESKSSLVTVTDWSDTSDV